MLKTRLSDARTSLRRREFAGELRAGAFVTWRGRNGKKGKIVGKEINFLGVREFVSP